jgi:hypothetical protein
MEPHFDERLNQSSRSGKRVEASGDSISRQPVLKTAAARRCGRAILAGSGAHCTYLLKFTPSIVGAESATLGVSAGGDGASPHNVSLSGTGS